MIVRVAVAAEHIARGGVIAYPTETVYGLAADASDPGAVAALEALKGREPGRGMSVLLASPGDLHAWLDPLPRAALALAQRFWPGPLTLVLPVPDPRLAAIATAQGVGFRCSEQPTARALALASRCPILSTSCNRSGQPPAATADEVVACFGPELPIAGGEPAGGTAPSTVVAVSAAGALTLLREGPIPWHALADAAQCEPADLHLPRRAARDGAVRSGPPACKGS